MLLVPYYYCDSNIWFVYFRAKGARVRVHFPATFFLYFVVRFAQTPSLFFCEYHERKNFLTQKNSAAWERKHVYFDLPAYQ